MTAPLPSRRAAILGIASLPLASLPAVAAPTPDPFLDIYRRALDARAYADTRGLGDEVLEAATDRMTAIEAKCLETPPTTVEGAIAGLEWARYEHTVVGEYDGDIVLAMIDAALDVLRGQAHV